MGFLRQLWAKSKAPAAAAEAVAAGITVSGETDTEIGIATAGRGEVKAAVTRFPVGKDPKVATTRGSSARRGGRLEASSRNSSSRDFAAETKTTEESERDGIPEAAVGKITTLSGRDRGRSSGDGGLRRNRDIDRDSNGEKRSGKGGGYSFPRRQRSRRHDIDRSRGDTCNSNVRHGERLEVLSRNPSSRDFAAETKTTEQPEQDGVPEAAVSKLITPSDRD